MSSARDTLTKTVARPRRSWIPRSFSKFKREEKGTAAIEMALLLLPFTFIIGIIFEVMIQFFALSIMDTGLATVARMVRTKQLDASNFTPGAARDIVCNPAIHTLFNCNNMTIDVQTIATWQSPAVPLNGNGTLNTTGMGFNPGAQRSINIIRAYYPWPNVMPGLRNFGFGVAPRAGGNTILVSTEAIRVE